MTEAEARARIEDETQWATAPALSVAEVDRLLARARVTDENGVEPDDDGYIATYTLPSVAYAVAMGFRMKAAKVAGQYDLRAGDVDLKRSQQVAQLSRRASALGGIGTITLTTALSEAT
jgi:hypothetical protein